LFTGGVWQSDKRNLVLEEYTSVKTAGSSPYKGRDDMWFYVDGKTCYAEAKQQWISTRKPNLKKATHTLNSEYLNAKANNRGADVSLGILFLIPYLTANQRARPRVYLDAYYAKVASDLAGFASANAYQIIWGRFLDERFLEPDAFGCPGKYNADHSHPGFEIILCTESK
jgi:hypothetical protein